VPAEQQPDVVLCVVATQNELTRSLAKLQVAYPDTRTIIFLLTDDEPTALSALRSGVQGVVHHAVTAAELEDCIQQVMAGEFAISNQLARKLARLYQTRDAAPRVAAGVGELTHREVEVLGLLADGATNREIAARLMLSEHTVRAHLRGIMQKLHVSNRVQAAALAWQGKLLQRAEGKEKR
jgi:two-component system NarL family response regulator